MKKSKIFVLFLALMVLFGVLVGCSNKSNQSADEPNQDATQTNSEPASQQNDEKPAWQTEPITLKYATWGNADVEAKMMAAFTEKYPNITVVKDESINWPWTDALTTAASAGNLPDVFLLENVPVGVENDWLLDLTPYWDADQDTKEVYPNIAKSAVYNGKRYAAPTSQSIMGVFVNKTIFEKNNVPLPPYDWTIDQMVDLAKKLTNPSEHIFGIGGAWGNLSFDEHWPMANDASIGYNTFDGEKLNFSSQAWIDGYNAKLELRRLGVEEHMSAEDKKAVFGDEGAWPLQKGNIAMGIDGSWNLGWLPDDMAKSGAGEMDFYPYPGGKAGQRMPVILDFMGVSSTTKYPDAAYELMKFMSFSSEGWQKRIEITKELNLGLDAFPVTDNADLWSQIDPLIKVEGLKAAVKLLPQGVPDFNKTLPGWREYNVWANDEQKIFEKLSNGEFTPADKAKELEDKANEFMKQSLEKMSK